MNSTIHTIHKDAPTFSNVGASSFFRNCVTTLRFSCFFAPFAGILEYLKPWGCLKVAFPVRWHIAPLPLKEGAFGVGHHGEVAPIGRAKTGNAVRRTVWVKGIGFGCCIIVIDVAYGGEIFA